MNFLVVEINFLKLVLVECLNAVLFPYILYTVEPTFLGILFKFCIFINCAALCYVCADLCYKLQLNHLNHVKKFKKNEICASLAFFEL